MKIENVKIYDLEESIIASNFPMNIELESGEFLKRHKEYIEYWNKHHIKEIIKILDKKYYFSNSYSFNEQENCVEMTLNDCEKIVKLDLEDLPLVTLKGWTYNSSRGYIQSANHADEEKYIEIQNYLFTREDDSWVVDHKNRDTFDNRRCNLRLCSRSQNSHNRGLLKENTSGVTGVYFNTTRNKWIASIEINTKKKTKQFKEKENAIKQRLSWEAEYLKEFSPQKHLFSEYNIPYEEDEYTYEEAHYHFLDVKKHLKRIINLTKACDMDNNAHGQFLTGIRVAFDLTFSNKAWVEAERYRFLEFVSSQSTMHKIAKFDLDKCYNEYVDSRIIDIMKEKVDDYNTMCLTAPIDDIEFQKQHEENKKRKYLEILYSNPAGFELTARLTTNYRCLRNIYKQRKNHRLPEWREFCSWVESLPYAQELLIN